MPAPALLRRSRRTGSASSSGQSARAPVTKGSPCRPPRYLTAFLAPQRGRAPGRDDSDDRRRLEGAACHGCLYIAECSCERFNRFLDRALVVPTIGTGEDLAFFKERP